MKRLFISFLVLFAVVQLLQSCAEKPDMEEVEASCQEQVFSENPVSQSLRCDPGVSFPLIVEGTSQVGTVRIIPVNGAYIIDYITTGDWLIHEVNMFAGRPENLRVRTNCAPVLDPLTYSVSLDEPNNSACMGLYSPLVDSCFYFITTAKVSTTGEQDAETEFAVANTGNRLSAIHHGWYGVLCKSGCVSEILAPPECPIFP